MIYRRSKSPPVTGMIPEALARLRARLDDEYAPPSNERPASEAVATLFRTDRRALGRTFRALSPGADIVIGNPPYARIGPRGDAAALAQRFASLSSGNTAPSRLLPLVHRNDVAARPPGPPPIRDGRSPLPRQQQEAPGWPRCGKPSGRAAGGGAVECRQDGAFAEQEVRPCVYSPADRNLKIEIGSHHGVPSPEAGPPIAVYRELRTRSFAYMLPMPGDLGYRAMSALTGNLDPIGRGAFRVVTDSGAIRKAWAGMSTRHGHRRAAGPGQPIGRRNTVPSSRRTPAGATPRGRGARRGTARSASSST